MSGYFIPFALSFGAFFVLIGTIAAWIFRSSSAPLIARLAAPTLLATLALYIPWTINSLLGLPVSTTEAALPDAQLIGFVPKDDDHLVDLWLLTDKEPRAYEVTLSDQLKKELREAQKLLSQGKPVMMAHKGKEKGDGREQGGKGNSSGTGNKQAGDTLGIGDDGSNPYGVDPQAFSQLPAKE